MTKEEIIKLAAEAGVNAAKKFMDQETKRKIKSRHDRRLRNTRLLLKHYPMLKEHSEKSVCSIQQLSDPENAIDVLDNLERLDDETYIQAIKRSATRTKIILAHIQEMVGLYEMYCQRSGKDEDLRRYRILWARFFDGKQTAELAAIECVDERTVQRDVKEAVEKLSALIFGIDGLTQMSETCRLHVDSDQSII